MRHSLLLSALIAGALAASGCSQHDAPKAAAQASAASSPKPSAAATMPDVGHVAAVEVSSEGSGPSEAAALMQALQTAVMQVNGTAIDVTRISARMDLSIKTGESEDYLSSRAFGELVAQRSGGVIDHFTVVSVAKPASPQGNYSVKIAAYINKYHAASASSKKLKIVVAPVRVAQGSYTIGGVTISGTDLSQQLTQKISDALVQSGRFDVLSRDESPEIAQELSLISSGGAPMENLAKIGQTLPADTMLFGSVDALEYLKHSRALAISDRPLVSYDGHWGFGEKLVNVTTREIMSSTELSSDMPAFAPTTLPVSINAQKLLADAEQSMAEGAVGRVIHELYPITVVSVDGAQVILSQGGASLKAGAAYQLVKAGKAIVDPQTGQTIGRAKSTVGTVQIDRVDDKLSYGHIVDATSSAAPLATDGSVRLGEQVALPAIAANENVAVKSASDPAPSAGQDNAGASGNNSGGGEHRATAPNQPRELDSPPARPSVSAPSPAITPGDKDKNW